MLYDYIPNPYHWDTGEVGLLPIARAKECEMDTLWCLHSRGEPCVELDRVRGMNE